MDKKNSITSDRPPSYAANKLIYKGDFLLLMSYDSPRFRLQRRLIHQFYMENMAEKTHFPYIYAESAQLFKDIMDDPNEFANHAFRYTNSLIMTTVYGFRTPRISTYHFQAIMSLQEVASRLIVPGNLPPVDIFPFLNYIPEMFLGNWKSKCARVAEASSALFGGLLDRVVERRAKLGRKDTFADRILEEASDFTRHEQIYILATILEAGTDSTSSAWVTLVQMLTDQPALLKEAQEEMDQVVGEDRTPRWDDFYKLPKVNYLMKEVQRFRPVVPIAFPHALAQDTTIDGYHLPKGTTIVCNLSGLHLDEKRFRNPYQFDPTNFTGKTGPASAYATAADYEDRDHYGYGFGRRLCPGIHFAERSLFITFSKLIWGFDLSPVMDENGRPIKVDIDWHTGYTGGVTRAPMPFKSVIKVRSEARRQTLLREYEEAQNVFSTLDPCPPPPTTDYKL
ncbi:hypothetical protein LTS17_001847 [Exophiala oligosperma]